MEEVAQYPHAAVAAAGRKSGEASRRNSPHLTAYPTSATLVDVKVCRKGDQAMDAEIVLAKLRGLKPRAAVSYKVKELGMFGSFARGEQSDQSDIDVLVEFEEGADLFDLMGLTLYLEEELQRKVDVVSKRALREELRGSVLREVVAV